MLEKKELQRLQKLSCVTLSPEEEETLGAQLENIIQFLGQLQTLPLQEQEMVSDRVTLRALDEERTNVDTKSLLSNVHHPMINNSIVIKSVLG